jgi:hypothetical protein
VCAATAGDAANAKASGQQQNRRDGQREDRPVQRDQGRGRSGAEDRQDPPLAVAVSEPGLGRSGQRPQGVETAGGAGDGEGVGGLVNDEQKR